MERMDELKDIDQMHYCPDYYDLNVNKYGIKCGTPLRFWENKGQIKWFQWYFRYWLGRRYLDDKRQINRWKKIVSRFNGELVKMIKMLIADLMIGLIDENYYKKQKTNIIMVEEKKELLNIFLKIKML